MSALSTATGVVISAADSVIGKPPGSDALFSNLRVAPQRPGGKPQKDAFFDTVQVGTPSVVIGGPPSDASFSALGAKRLV